MSPAPLTWRVLLAAGVSALALDPAAASAQSALFRGRTANPAAAAARAAQATVNEQARARVQAQRSMAVFAQAQAAMQSVMAAQIAARQIAQATASNVPNGLTIGGLELATNGIGSVNGVADALAPVQTGPANAPTVTVVQQASRAILNWKTFNVGRETTLNFDQATIGGTRAREFSVLNRVEDVNPSLILGRINAPGQVFIINRSGIIFGGASQVNVGTLVASALDVGTWEATREQRDAAFRLGLDAYLPTLTTGIPPQPSRLAPNLTVTDLVSGPTSRTDVAPTDVLGGQIAAARTAGDRARYAVTVQPGAQIGIAELGFALLAAPAGVVNQGTISAPSGQVYLAAGAGARFQSAATAPGNGVATFQRPDIGYQLEVFRHNLSGEVFRSPTSSSPESPIEIARRTAITALDAVRAEAINEGLIEATRGSITLAGSAVRNSGVLASTTAANRAGSIFLIARDFGGPPNLTTVNSDGDVPNFELPTQNGSFRWGEARLSAGSVLQVGTEQGADQVVFDTAQTPFQQSRIGITAGLVFAEGATRTADGTPVAGSILRAPAGRVRISGDQTPLLDASYDGLVPGPQETARLQLFELGAGAIIDLGGMKGIDVPVARNIIDVQVRNQNLADQPAQRNGFLTELAQARTAVTVDIRVGTRLFDVQPFVAGLPRSVAERQGAGGTIEIQGETIRTLPGSTIDVSGGWINYTGGLRRSETQLIGSDGRIYRIGNAPADIVLVGRPGLFTRTQPRWNIVEDYVNPLFADRLVFEPGYVEGFDAGTVRINARADLAGSMFGEAFAGLRQAQAANTAAPNDANPETTVNEVPNGATLQLLGTPVRIGGLTPIPGIRSLPVDARFVGAPVNPTFVTNFNDGLVAPLTSLDHRDPANGTQLVFGAPFSGSRGTARIGGTRPAELFDTRIPTATILDNGVRVVTLEAEGELVVPAGVTVALQPGGAFNAISWNARIDGAIRVPGGSITVTGTAGERIVPRAADLDLLRRVQVRTQPVGLAPPEETATTAFGVPLSGSVIVGPGAVLSTAGLWTNDFEATIRGVARRGGTFTAGGTITLATQFGRYGTGEAPPVPTGATVADDPQVAAAFGRDLVLGAGAVLDVSGGGFVAAGGTRPGAVFGAAGRITLSTYDAFNVSPTGQPIPGGPVPVAPYIGRRDFAREARYNGLLDLGAEFRGFALGRTGGGNANARGGTIAIAVPNIALGGARDAVLDGARDGALLLEVDRFAAAGFADFRLTATNTSLGVAFLGLPVGTLSVAAGAVIAPLPRQRELRADFGTIASDADPGSVGAPGLLAQADRVPVRLTLTAATQLDLGRRATVDAAPTTLIADPGAANASLRGVVSPASGALIALESGRPIYVDGTIAAPGGIISIVGRPRSTLLRTPVLDGSAQPDVELAGNAFRPSDATWIANGAQLSTAGFAQSTIDRFGVVRSYVREGGTVAIREDRGYLIVETAATLGAARIDVSGAAAFASVQRGGRLFPGAAPEFQAQFSNAGTISLDGQQGVFLDGTLVGQPGGPGARGGTLDLIGPQVRRPDPGLALVGRALSDPFVQDLALAPGAFDPRGAIVLRDGGGAPALPAAAQAARNDPDAPIDPTIVFESVTTTTVVEGVPAFTYRQEYRGGADTLRAYLDPARLAGSGIDRVNLLGAPPGGDLLGSRLLIEGSVNLELGRMVQLPDIVLKAAPVPATTPAAIPAPPLARIAAPYLLLAGGGAPPDPLRTPLVGTLLLSAAGQIDVRNAVIRGAEQVVLESAGDIRFTGTGLSNLLTTPVRRATSSLTSQGNVTLRARQTYVDLGTAAAIEIRRQLGDPLPDRTRPETFATLTLARVGETVPEAPLSAAGTLTLSADRILQGGVLRVPQGQIVLVATDTVAFLPGSLTSIATGGRQVPFGETRSDQNPLGFEVYDTLFQVGSRPALVAPPAKSIAIAAPSIDLGAGATVDLSGDGELLAYRFVSGPGGSRDVLARAALNELGQYPDAASAFQFADRRDVFAVLPGAQPFAAPRSPYIRDSGDSLGLRDVTAIGVGADQTTAQPYIGDQIEIGPGIHGLDAGRYTLLPARFAILPGAYQVIIPPAATAFRAEVPLDVAAKTRDGGYLVGGHRVVAGTGLRETQQRVVTVRPPELYQALSAIVVDPLSAFFTQRATSLGEPAPRRPIDAGRLTVGATRRLVLDSSFGFARGPGGRGGQVEISGDFLAVTPRARIGVTTEGDSVVLGADGVRRADLTGTLPVAAEALNALGAESLTLGGFRAATRRVTDVPGITADIVPPDSEDFVVTARAVRITEGAGLFAPEILLVAGKLATDTRAGASGIILETGALVAALGDAVTGTPPQLAIGVTGVNGLTDTVNNAGLVPTAGDAPDLPARPGAALVRLSTGLQVDVLRLAQIARLAASETTPLATVVIGENATLTGPSGSIDLAGPVGVFDPGFPNRVAETATLAFGDLRVRGPVLGLGTPATAAPGAFNLGQGALARLAVGTLTLTGTGSAPIDVFGDVRVAAGTRINLDAPGLRAADAARLALEAGIVSLRNTGTFAPLAAAAGDGGLTVTAPDSFRLGEGLLGFGLAGFDIAAIATGSVVAAAPLSRNLLAPTIPTELTTGRSGLNAAAALAIATGRLQAEPGADVAITTTGTVALAGAPADGRVGTIGGRIAISGGSLTLTQRVEAVGGDLTLAATAGDLVVAPGAVLDLRGRPFAFFDVTRYVPGGTVTLSATSAISVGGVVDVSSGDLAAVEADAGRITINAGGVASFAPGVTLLGHAAPGARSGSINFTGTGAVDLPGLNVALDAGGFREERTISAGAGDLLVEAGRVMAARTVKLVADAGAVVVDGIIDAGGPKGGSIALFARDRVSLGAGGLLTALNTTPGQRGGDVIVGTTAGPIDLAGTILAFTPGASDPLYGGRVRVRVPEAQVAASVIEPSRIAARTEAEQIVFRVIEDADGVLSAADQAAIIAAFRAAGAAFPSRPGLLVTPGIEVRNPTGGLTLARGPALDLCAFDGTSCTIRTASGAGGELSFRAAGDITILADVTDGFSRITYGTGTTLTTTPPATANSGATRNTGLLLDDRRSWSLRFTAGANLASADPGATLAGAAGSVLVGEPFTEASNDASRPLVVRTGTGSLEMAAAGDILLRDPDVAVYTAGRRLAPPTLVPRIDPLTGLAVPGVVEAYTYTLVRFDAATGRDVTEVFYLPIDPTYVAAGAVTAASNGLPALPTTRSLAPTIARYPVEGGDLTLRAGGDIRALVSDESGRNLGETVNAWLRRHGLTDVNSDFVYRPFVTQRILEGSATAILNGLLRNTPAYASQTTWYPDIAAFAQNWALLGGGNATVFAGGDFQGSISIPTSGATYGGLAANYSFSYRTSTGATSPRTTATGAVPGGGTAPITVTYGGGDLALRVGGDLLPRSQLFLGRGDATVDVAGQIRDQRTSTPVATTALTGLVIGLADARYDVTAIGNVAASFYNPLETRIGRLQAVADSWGFGGFQAPGIFSLTTPTTAVALSSLGGDIDILRAAGSLQFLATTSRRVTGPVTREALPTSNVVGTNGAAGVPLFFGDAREILPERLIVTSFTGDIGSAQASNTIDREISPLFGAAPITPSGLLAFFAAGDINLPRLQLEDRDLLDRATPERPILTGFTTGTASQSLANLRVPIGGQPTIDGPDYRTSDTRTVATAVASPLRLTDPGRDLLYALGDVVRPFIGTGEIGTVTSGLGAGSSGGIISNAATAATLPYAKQIGIRAGGDIVDAAISIRHANPSDLSFARAGGDIGTAPLPNNFAGAGSLGVGNLFEIGGPGRAQIIAGGNIAPIRQPVFATSTATSVPIGGALNGIRSIGNARNVLLPEGGATIDILFGVGAGAGPRPDALLDRLLDPANAGGAYTTYDVELGAVLRDGGTTRFVPGGTQANGGAVFLVQPNAPRPTDPATLARIRALPEPERLAIAIDLYFRELGASGREAAGGTGPRAGSYVRGFDAIGDLFPNRPEYAGIFNIQNTFVRTEQGGDINVLGPGGDFLIGAVAGRPEPPGFPDRFGVLTLGYGNINLFTDGDIAAGQSRILTLDGGDILAWSSTRDINAGLGARTARFVPPFRVAYLPNLVQVPNRAGQITGSGIATFTPFTDPVQVEALRRAPATNLDYAGPSLALAAPLDPAGFAADAGAGRQTDSVQAFAQTEELRRRNQPLTPAQLAIVGAASTGASLTLVAPVGTVDFGDAGVRVAGDLVVAAAIVANASNAAVAGTSVGVPTAAAPNVSANLAAASAAGATNKVADDIAQAARRTAEQPQPRPRTLTARVIGWGDTEAEAERPR